MRAFSWFVTGLGVLLVLGAGANAFALVVGAPHPWLNVVAMAGAAVVGWAALWTGADHRRHLRRLGR